MINVSKPEIQKQDRPGRISTIEKGVEVVTGGTDRSGVIVLAAHVVVFLGVLAAFVVLALTGSGEIAKGEMFPLLMALVGAFGPSTISVLKNQKGGQK